MSHEKLLEGEQEREGGSMRKKEGVGMGRSDILTFSWKSGQAGQGLLVVCSV